MQITARTPYARGVDTLMYIGDDGAPVTYQVVTNAQLVGVGLAAALAPKGKRLKYAGIAAAGAFFWNLLAGKFAV